MNITHQKYSVGILNLVSLTNHQILDYIKKNKGRVNGYICIANTRTAYLSNKNKAYGKTQNNSLFTVPDGMPLVWLGKLAGLTKIERSAGPELFEKALIDEDLGLKHFLLGDTEEVLDKLNKKCINEYNANIVGSYSPAFLDVDKYNYKEIANKINHSEADIVWLALGSPKQDVFASKLVVYTQNKIIINVGAAFRFILREYNMPSPIIQKIGLTGVYWRFRKKPKLFLQKYPKYMVFILKHLFIKLLKV